MLEYNLSEIESFLNDDVGFGDITTIYQNIDFYAKIVFKAREDLILSSLDGVEMICKLNDLKLQSDFKNGDLVAKDSEFTIIYGEYKKLQKIIKSTQILLENACAIATKTKKYLNLIKDYNTHLYTTRKVIPFAKKMCLKAVLDAGANIHRFNLNDSLVFFKNHINAYSNYESFLNDLKRIKSLHCKGFLIVEADNFDEAKMLLNANIDCIQCDKFSLFDIKNIVKLKNEINKNCKILATGGINEKNIKDYASLGVDGIITSAPYFAKPCDIGAKIIKI